MRQIDGHESETDLDPPPTPARHPLDDVTARVQFFCGGPFDQYNTLSVTLIDARWNEVHTVVTPWEFRPEELQGRLALILDELERNWGFQLTLF